MEQLQDQIKHQEEQLADLHHQVITLAHAIYHHLQSTGQYESYMARLSAQERIIFAQMVDGSDE